MTENTPGQRLRKAMDKRGISVLKLSKLLGNRHPKLVGRSRGAIDSFRADTDLKSEKWLEAVCAIVNSDGIPLSRDWVLTGDGDPWGAADAPGKRARGWYDIGRPSDETHGRHRFYEKLDKECPEYSDFSVAVSVLFGHTLARAVEWRAEKLDWDQRATIVKEIMLALRAGWEVQTDGTVKEIPKKIRRIEANVRHRTLHQRAFSDYALGALVAIQTAMPHRG